MDVLALLLFVLAAVWTLVSSAVAGGRPLRVAALFLAAGASLLLARAVTAIDARVVPAVTVVVGVIVIALAGGGAFTRAPAGGFLGYANARGAFFVQATIAAILLALRARTGRGKIIALASSGAFLVAVIASVSQASTVLVLVLPVAGLLPRSRRLRPLAVAALGGAVLLAVAVTSILGAGERSRPTTANRLAREALTERRLVLWRSALDIMAEHPLAGVGAGRFRFESPEAADPDAAWAHNGFLQQGAEAGVPGLLILLAIFVWTFRDLIARSMTDQGAVLAAASLAGLGIQASIDYILHFAIVPITAAAIAGAVSARRKSPTGPV